jgi:hypothetical protein
LASLLARTVHGFCDCAAKTIASFRVHRHAAIDAPESWLQKPGVPGRSPAGTPGL